MGSVGRIATLPDPREVREVFAECIRNMFVMYTCVAGLAVLASVFVQEKHMSSEHTETRTGIENLSKSKAAAASEH